MQNFIIKLQTFIYKITKKHVQHTLKKKSDLEYQIFIHNTSKVNCQPDPLDQSTLLQDK